MLAGLGKERTYAALGTNGIIGILRTLSNGVSSFVGAAGCGCVRLRRLPRPVTIVLC